MPQFDSESLLAWYERVRRRLPWRSTRDPYALLVSEVMLQQTQAARVVPYYEAFLARFPDAGALATAAPRDVLAAWSGLGYNRRALSLQAAARQIAERGWPDDLTKLPGVGPYTAAAVGSFAWDRQEAAVDTNVRRVFERFDGETRGPATLAARVREVLPHGQAALFNQAMMELGATVCRPRTPRCDACPITAACARRETRAENGGAAPAGSPPAAAAGSPPAAAAGSRRRPAAPASSRRRPAPRFEATDRWARGRVVAALLNGDPLPALAGERRERVLAGLERDGLVMRDADGEPRLPVASPRP